MNVRESILLGSSNVMRHKLRSFLTTVGIVLGVAAVIAMVTVSYSFQGYFIERYSNSFAPDEFILSVGQMNTSGLSSSYRTIPLPVFTERDVTNLLNKSAISQVYPIGLITGSKTYFNNTLIFDTTVAASNNKITGEYFALESGSAFNKTGCVVGFDIASAIARDLGSNNIDTALEKTITGTMGNGAEYNFTIDGILKYSYIGTNNFIFINTSYYHTTVMLNNQNVTAYSFLFIKSKSADLLNTAESQALTYINSDSDAKKLLSGYLGLKNVQFVTFSQQQLNEFINSFISQFSNFVIIVGSISLLVGMVGIANIMLVSVTERTHEIGVLRATGAKKRDIMQMFLFEVMMLGIIGAVLGVIAGIVIGYLFSHFGIIGGLVMPLKFNLVWFPISVLLGIVVALISGLYPAYKASKIKPVEALRYE